MDGHRSFVVTYSQGMDPWRIKPIGQLFVRKATHPLEARKIPIVQGKLEKLPATSSEVDIWTTRERAVPIPAVN
jgi:hypothetical protein